MSGTGQRASLIPRTIAAPGLALVVALVSFTRRADAQSRTPWEMNPGEGIVSFFPPSMSNGDMSEYSHATVPSPSDPNWGPAPDPTRIDYHVHSTLCAANVMCLAGGEFTYFRTTLCIPNPADVQRITVSIGAVDDGARVSVINSAHPDGITPSNGYAHLGGGAIRSGDFASDLRAGEPNTILVTHVDDCCQDSQLTDVAIEVNGHELVPGELGAERCNGLDDNCNGEVDEGFGMLHCGRGECAVQVPACANGMGQVCRARAPQPETCDGLDNDCNGITDDPCVDGGLVFPDANDAGDAADVAEDAVDGSDGEASISCGDPTCDPDLRLQGRAGPVGHCACSAPGRTPFHRGFSAVFALVLLAARARRKARPSRRDRRACT